MDGSLFYWILWSFWVLLTFIISKQNPLRFKLAAVVLIVISLSTIHFSIGGLDFNASGIFMLLLSYFFFSKEKLGPLLYAFISSFTITIAYSAFKLFEIFDPVWIFIDKEWMMGIGFGYLAILLQKNLKGRILIIITGTMQGEILYSYYLTKFDFSYPIGSLAYLDVCLLIVFLLTCWSFLENAGTIFQNHFHFFEKGKQKTS